MVLYGELHPVELELLENFRVNDNDLRIVDSSHKHNSGNEEISLIMTISLIMMISRTTFAI